MTLSAPPFLSNQTPRILALVDRVLPVVSPVVGPIVPLVGKIPWLPTLISSAAIHAYSSTAAPRPRPFSMASAYTSWRSLRPHLLRPPPRRRPAVNAGGSAERGGGDRAVPARREIKSTDTSVLFAFVAQWFTDSFLRTSREAFGKNTSNHEIDLCQIYGVGEDSSIGWRDFRNNNPLVISRGIEDLISRCSSEPSGKIALGNTPRFLVDRHDPAQPSVEERTVRLMRSARLASYNGLPQGFQARPPSRASRS